MSYSNLPNFLVFHVLYISMNRGRNYVIEEKQQSFTACELWNKVLQETKNFVRASRIWTTEHIRMQALFKRFLSSCMSYTTLESNFKLTFSKTARQTARRQV